MVVSDSIFLVLDKLFSMKNHGWLELKHYFRGLSRAPQQSSDIQLGRADTLFLIWSESVASCSLDLVDKSHREMASSVSVFGLDIARFEYTLKARC